MDPVTLAALAGGRRALKWLRANFLPVAVVVALVAATGGLAWLVDDWRDRGRELDALRTASETVTAERDAARLERDANAKAVELCEKATATYKRDAEARIARLEAELEREPEVVVEYRDRAAELDQVVTATDCEAAVDQVAAVLEGIEPP